jgi:predicted lipase
MNLIEAFNTALGSFGSFKHIRDEKSGIDAYFKKTDGIDILVFYGSNEKADWITNFTFWLKKWKKPDYASENSKVRVHSGYFDGWYRIRNIILPLITQEHVVVTGYSMGGGISSIAAVDIQYNKHPTILQCVDFEGAKVWNKYGRDSSNKRLPDAFKIKNGNDIVTKIPPFYWVVGKKIHIGSEEKWWKFSIKDHTELFEDRESIRKKLEPFC